MNWIISGFQDYDLNGFVQPEKVKEQVSDWQVSENPIAQFVEEKCILNKDARVEPLKLYGQYEGWRVQAGFDQSEGKLKSVSALSKSLTLLLGDKIEITKSNGKRYLKGICLK